MIKKIIIIDDSKTSLLLFESLFQDTDIEVYSEIDSKAAIERVKLVKPDLIVLDLMMPDLDGFQLLEKFKNDPATSKIPFIILSAIHDNKIVKKALQYGVGAYIKKPMNVEEVLKVVYDLLQRD